MTDLRRNKSVLKLARNANANSLINCLRRASRPLVRAPLLASRFACILKTNSLYHDKGFSGHGRQPGRLLNRLLKSMRVNITPHVKLCCNHTDSCREAITSPLLNRRRLTIPPGRQLVYNKNFYRDLKIHK